MRDGSYAESEAYDSDSVVPIHTRSELSSDSNSAYDFASIASVASVNQPLEILAYSFYGKLNCASKPSVRKIVVKFSSGK